MLSRQILLCASKGSSRIQFLREISNHVINFADCDALELRKRAGNIVYQWRSGGEGVPERFNLLAKGAPGTGQKAFVLQEQTLQEVLIEMLLNKEFPVENQGFTPGGCFWTNDTEIVPDFLAKPQYPDIFCHQDDGVLYRSLIMVPFYIDAGNHGIMLLKNVDSSWFVPEEVDLFAVIAETVGLAAADRRAQAALKERVKELTCLYGIAQITESKEKTIQVKIGEIADLLPPSWQYPENCVAAIKVGNRQFTSREYRVPHYEQRENLVIMGKTVGEVIVGYVEDRPELKEGVFLKEEESLIAEVARRISDLVRNEGIHLFLSDK